ncbi:ExbD/TolR family protein [Sphingomonas morindae]|uniref:Biopolymer transporter ExbD n=1 Tax=Sphingomonas morindae TaxID=1541170 RepID=A0ABY4X6W3_9SPHN|nr:biopolymer transporter ExbD [Sphingomonas morindae]USI72636.1 biopolymer transporter ExbD [Sphingomonas morindae]
MAMSVGSEGGDDAPMSDINTTPLVDVMLVLLIIFLITVPVVIQTVPLKLPSVRNEPTTTKPENVNLSVKGGADGSCEVFWGQTKVDSKELIDRSVEKLKAEIAKQGGPNAAGLELPEAHIRGDVNTPFKCVGGVVTNLQRAGFARVGFISEPPPGGEGRI